MIKKYLAVVIAAAFANATYADNHDPKNEAEHETMVVIGNRVDTQQQEYVGSVNIVTEDELATSANLMDSLSAVPGINAGSDLGRNIGQQFNIRGFNDDDRVIIMQNGVPRSSALFSNQVSSFRSDTDLLKRVETVKGSSSILYGSGAIGGVISMRLKDASDYLVNDENFAGMVGGRYESNNMHSYRGAIAGQDDSGKFDFVLYGKEANFGDIKLADGGTQSYDTVGNDESAKTAYVNLGWNISQEQRLALGLFHYHSDVETAWNSLNHPDTSIPTVGELTQTDLTVNYSYAPFSNDLIDLEVASYVSQSEYDRDYINTNNSTHIHYANEESRAGLSVKNISRFYTGSLYHTAVMGIDYHHRQDDASYSSNGVASQFHTMPSEYNDWGIYAQDLLEVGDWEFTLGARYDYFNRKVDNNPDADFTGDAFSPRIAASYEIANGLHLLGGYSVAFRAPSPHETGAEGPLNIHYWYLPNPDLKPETSEEFEGGISYVNNALFTQSDRLSIKLMYFDANINDMIALETLPELGESPDQSMYAQYTNIDNAKRKGVELTSTYDLDNISVSASYEHLDLYDKETKEKVTPFADKVRIAAAYTFQDIGLTLGADVNHWFEPDQNPESFMWGTTEYFYVSDSYTQANVSGIWRIKESGLPLGVLNDATLKFGINNIFDGQYINAENVTTTTKVGKETNYYVDLDLRF
ncbi:TonB-dependent receptor domain-containing protein [Vibrio ezurae]|uniref:Putative TonB-dependent receptor n=1 Tax=Vibrio ezurae NBRC 102218 TaxID=1219080 RepID=U3B2Q3_9VIBR|nr:TonB-dependent receptor [Vibrio ezurae]GAD80235.1 putative TonB-dependent receptor [Vibrio ezurae NBRC 102218]